MISDKYKELNRQLHETNPNYGVGNYTWPFVQSAIEHFTPLSVLDYGCGKGVILDTVRESYPTIKARGYDPAVPKFDVTPMPADLVVCTDVLEHIEPEYLDEVLKHIRRLAVKGVVLAVSCVPAKKTLPDGTNAHKIVKPPAWWLNKLSGLFGDLVYFNNMTSLVMFIFSVGDTENVLQDKKAA